MTPTGFNTSPDSPSRREGIPAMREGLRVTVADRSPWELPSARGRRESANTRLARGGHGLRDRRGGALAAPGNADGDRDRGLGSAAGGQRAGGADRRRALHLALAPVAAVSRAGPEGVALTQEPKTDLIRGRPRSKRLIGSV